RYRGRHRAHPARLPGRRRRGRRRRAGVTAPKSFQGKPFREMMAVPMRRTRWLLAPLTVLLALAGPVAVAHAAPPPSVTMQASPTTLAYGRHDRYSGEITPPSSGETDDIDAPDPNVSAPTTTTANSESS